MSRTKIEELVQLEAEQRLDELRSIRNELAMMHCTIMEMRTRSITTEEMISTLRAEVMDFKKADHAKCTVVLKDSSCGTEVPTTVDASTDNGITYTNASTSTEEPQMKHVSVAVEPAQVHVGIKTDEVETSDALVDMGITTSDVAVMVFPKIRNVEVSASPRMKNTSTNTVVKVSRHPSPAPRNETQGTLGKSTFASMTNLPCFTTSSCPNSEHELKKDKAVDDHASDDQPSRKRKATDGIVEQCKRSPDQEEQRVKILEKIKTFERFIAKTRKRKFGGQVCQSIDGIQCIFCGRMNEHYDDNCPVVRSAEARLGCAQRLQICLMCLSGSCGGGPSCPRKDVPCVYCVAVDANNSKTHHRSFCFRPERYDQFKKQLDILHEKLNELDRQQ